MLSDIVVNITEDSYMHHTNISEVHSDIGKYSLYFNKPDATIGISSSRFYPLGEETVLAFYDPFEGNTRSSSAKIPDIKINGVNYFSPITRTGDGSIVRLFGSNVSFNLSGLGKATRSTDFCDVELYAPKIIRIEFPKVTSEEDRYPLCFYKNFILRWNPDVNNTNGVIVLIRWSGSMVFGEDYSSSYVIHSVCVTDNGEAELEESMFEGVPDTALCCLTVLRGDFDNVEIDELQYRLIAESHDVLGFVLIRNLE